SPGERPGDGRGPWPSIDRRRRKRRHARRAIVDARVSEAGFESAAGELQRHDELAVLRQTVALDELRPDPWLGVDHVAGFLPAGHLPRVALFRGNVALEAGCVSIGGIAGCDRERVRGHADSEVIAPRHVGHQLIHHRRAGRSGAEILTLRTVARPIATPGRLLSLLPAARASVPAWRTLGVSGHVLRLLAPGIASPLRALCAQFIDGLAQIVAARGVELPVAGQMQARRRVCSETTAPGAASQEDSRGEGGGNRTDSE